VPYDVIKEDITSAAASLLVLLMIFAVAAENNSTSANRSSQGMYISRTLSPYPDFSFATAFPDVSYKYKELPDISLNFHFIFPVTCDSNVWVPDNELDRIVTGIPRR
jgi:hypothetical protein